MALIGLIPTAAIFVIVFMRLEGPERWKLIIPYVVVLMLGIYVAFDLFMADPLAAHAARPACAGRQNHPLGAVAGALIPAPLRRWCAGATPGKFVWAASRIPQDYQRK